MKKNMIIISLLLLACCLCLPVLTFAQPEPPVETPIDGGLTLLIAAGAAYGVKKYRDCRKKEQEKI